MNNTKNKPHSKAKDVQNGAHAAKLDLFSTTQTKRTERPKCHKNAPFICIPGDGHDAKLYQGCCNDWTCPRCGELRAKHEYGRIVEGARALQKERPLYMLTVTCRGDVSVSDAENGYLEWTNRLNTNVRTYAKRKQGVSVEYAAVLERQGRGHPHTHYLTTFCPPDAFFIVDEYERYCNEVQTLNRELPENMRFSPEKCENIDHRQLWSSWLSRACVKSGLGVQVRLAIADVVEGASRYIAKYLFKEAQLTTWPKGWRRVRYSRGWPKLPELEATSAFVVLTVGDWLRVMMLNKPVECFGETVYSKAINWQVFTAYYKTAEGEIIDPGNYRPPDG